MDKGLFLGFKLPENIFYEVYLNQVSFYKNTNQQLVYIGAIIRPYKDQNLSWWETELNKILKPK